MDSDQLGLRMDRLRGRLPGRVSKAKHERFTFEMILPGRSNKVRTLSSSFIQRPNYHSSIGFTIFSLIHDGHARDEETKLHTLGEMAEDLGCS